MTDLFRVIYMALRKTDGKLSTNFIEELQDMNINEQYVKIKTKVKENILNKDQTRSVDTWYLMQAVMLYRLDKDMLATAILQVSKSNARRASDTTTATNDAAIKKILDMLIFSPETIKFLTQSKESEQLIKENMDSDLEKIISTFDAFHYSPWLNKDLMLSMGVKIMEAISQAIVGGNNKQGRKEKFEQWQTEINKKLFHFLSLDKIQATAAIGLYFFAKENIPDYAPSDALLKALTSATTKANAKEVRYYFESFEKKSARELHEAVITDQLGLQGEINEKIGSTKHDETISHLLNAFIKLIALTQSPLHVLLTAEQIATIHAKETGKPSTLSALDLAVKSSGNAICMSLTALSDLKNNSACKNKLHLLTAEVALVISQVSAALTLALGVKDHQIALAALQMENRLLKLQANNPPNNTALPTASQGSASNAHSIATIDSAEQKVNPM